MYKKSLISIIVLSVLLSGCFLVPVRKMNVQQGNVVTQAKANQLHTGMSKAQVLNILGNPVLMDTFNNNRWTYVYTHRIGKKTIAKKHLILTFRNDRLQPFSLRSGI